MSRCGFRIYPSCIVFKKLGVVSRSMRIAAWLSICCVGIVFAVWLIHDVEVASDEVFLFPGAEFAMGAAHDNTSTGRSLATVPDGFLLTGHYLIQGSGLVLAYRRHIDRPFAIFGGTDKAKFEYLTISLPGRAADETATYDLAAAGIGPAFWSQANFGFFFDDGCFGYAEKGIVRVQFGASGMADVFVDLHIENVPLSQFTLYSCQRFEITGNYSAAVLNLADFDQTLTALKLATPTTQE